MKEGREVSDGIVLNSPWFYLDELMTLITLEQY